ncbi:MAG: spermidine/putrescine ABC transporter substrate-binding protein [Symplocastrum torsivum CPER-KK1]|jgi:spermidine/putrescine transport system substrate-binding protein|uniref:Spermidine/putrescine ABC transporter substrate-binding protein n=1 Tax=Symplocastrum torsivum CPER-KK1 TaxID=450513 RepID=A0A951PQM8_9CYAN|nr:spermidine/putrescine ABC transporter substrate-binding protein [Symplocastrum torsivum CPER-KK1]
MRKRLLLFLSLFFLAVLLPLGCSGNRPNVSETGSENANNVLNVYNWTTYIAEDAITEFEKKFGAKVKYDTFESNDALYAKLKPGNPGYDVVFPSDYMVTTMRAEGLLEELNLDNIPNIKNVDSKFMNPPYDPGNKYSLPYQWGTMGIGYNIKATKGEINSWGQLFEPKFKGRVALQDEMRVTLGGILMYLGYDPNTTNQDELNKARDFLIKNKDAIASFAPDTGQALLDQGEVDLTLEYSGDIFQLMKENKDIRYAIPKEGTIVWTDTMAIPKGAPNKELAEKFINFILEPEIGSKISNFIQYGTPNKAAIDKGLIEKKDFENSSIYPKQEVFSKLKYIQDIGEVTQFYDEAWTEVKVGIGK